jgi:hypothetical protein
MNTIRSSAGRHAIADQAEARNQRGTPLLHPSDIRSVAPAHRSMDGSGADAAG